jgi:hypothetical protein
MLEPRQNSYPKLYLLATEIITPFELEKLRLRVVTPEPTPAKKFVSIICSKFNLLRLDEATSKRIFVGGEFEGIFSNLVKRKLILGCL